MLDLHHAALFKRAVGCFKNRQYNQAKIICEEIIAQNKHFTDALELLAEIAIQWQRLPEAIPYLERLVKTAPKVARFRILHGRALVGLGRYAEAITAIEKGLKLEPKDRYGLTILADAFQKRGDPDKARALLEPFIREATEDVIMAGIWAIIELQAGRPEEAVRIARKHISRDGVPYGILFTLGKAHEKLGEVDDAFAAYRLANTALPNVFDLDDYIRQAEHYIATFSAEAMKQLPRARNQSKLPLFISGRPRSGTTLVETIVNAHPKVHAGGEMGVLRKIALSVQSEIGSTARYPDRVRDLNQEEVDRFARQYLDHVTRLARGCTRVIDKSMSANFNLGFAQMLLPKSRLIWVRRNPVDNCFAGYTEDMIHNHLYAQDLRHLGVTFHYYEKLMRHWQKVLDLPILEVQYEELVENQEEWTRRIIDFCGLEWNDACLRFYDDRYFASRRSVQPTLSIQQIRKPMYKTSVGRAERFKKHLGPLLAALAEGEAMASGKIPVNFTTPQAAVTAGTQLPE